MKKTYFIFTAFFLLAFKTASFLNTMSFVGFQNNSPVFDCQKEHKLYVWDGELKVLKTYDATQEPLLVKDKFFCYQQKAGTTKKLLVTGGGKDALYNVTGSTAYVTMDGTGCIYMTQTKDHNKIKMGNDGQFTDLGVTGYVCAISGNLVYFNKSDDASVDANATLYAYDLKTKKTVEVWKNISGESTVVSTNGDYIYEVILSGGQFKPAVFSIKDKKYKFIDVKASEFDTAPLFINNELWFYKTDVMQFKKVAILF